MWSSPNWPSPRAASRRHAPASSTQNSSSNLTDPPIREPPHRRGPAAYSPEHKAARAHGQGPVRLRQEPQRSARLAAESPREIAGPTGRRRRCANAASKPPSHTDAYCAELSPRDLPVGVAIAIGPSRKPGSTSAVEIVSAAAVCLRARSGGAKRCRSSYFWPRTSRARLARGLRPPRAPNQFSA